MRQDNATQKCTTNYPARIAASIPYVSLYQYLDSKLISFDSALIKDADTKFLLYRTMAFSRSQTPTQSQRIFLWSFTLLYSPFTNPSPTMSRSSYDFYQRVRALATSNRHTNLCCRTIRPLLQNSVCL